MEERQQRAATGPDPGLVQKLKDKARGSVALSEKQATKHIGFVRAGQNGDLLPGNSGKADVKAKDFLREYGAILGAGSESTLDEISSTTDSLGATHVTYQQFYKGVPVWGGTIKAHTDAQGNLTAVNGVAVPDISLNTTPRLSAAEAGARAIATVVADPPANESGQTTSLSASDLRGLVGEAVRLPARSAEGRRGHEPARLRGHRDQRLERAGRRLRARASGQGRQPLLDDPPTRCDRQLYEMSPTTPPIWQEGDPFPGSLNQDQQNLVTFSGRLLLALLQCVRPRLVRRARRNMKTVNNDPTIACPNANWNGATTNYCNGVTSDDVVAPRVGSRVHAVHARPDLPVAAGRAQRVLLGHLGRDGRPDQRARHRRAGRGTHGRRLLHAHPGDPGRASSTRRRRSLGSARRALRPFGPPITQRVHR